ncbi:MAG: lamin tail domain-containing protein [Methanolinea sp.]|nr:lamin tail domain-containing protein [Methanolinea sp.]
MREKIMMILAITVFACVPMVQLVAADSLISTPAEGIPAIGMQSIQKGLNVETLKNRFSVPDIPGKRNIEQNRLNWREMKNKTASAQRSFPTPSGSVSPLPTPAPLPTPDGTLSPVYLSDLNLEEDYVKITNTGSTRVPMTGWKISNRDGKSITFIDYPLEGGSFFTFILQPYSVVTIHSGMGGTPSDFHLYWPEEMWDDTGDTAFLYTPEGMLASTLSR